MVAVNKVKSSLRPKSAEMDKYQINVIQPVLSQNQDEFNLTVRIPRMLHNIYVAPTTIYNHIPCFRMDMCASIVN